MQKLILFILFVLTQNANSQYLNGTSFDFSIADDGILEVYQNDFNICEIDLEKQKIVNNFYWFENGIIYEIDTDYEHIIGNYAKNEITVYDETFNLDKPIFSKMKFYKKDNEKNIFKITSKNNQIKIEDQHNEVTDVLKLWLVMKGAERIIQRNKNANIFLEIAVLSTSF